VKQITLWFVIGLVFAAGCAKKPVVESEPAVSIEAVDTVGAAFDLKANISVIDVFDDRSSVEDRERLLHMPEWTIVGQKDVIRPALLNDHREIIRGETRSHFSPGSKSVSVEVYVLEGKQAYHAGELNETITAEFKVRIEIANLNAVNDVKSATGKSFLDQEALEINYEDVHALYEKAICASIRNALHQLAD